MLKLSNAVVDIVTIADWGSGVLAHGPGSSPHLLCDLRQVPSLSGPISPCATGGGNLDPITGFGFLDLEYSLLTFNWFTEAMPP